MKLKVQKGLGAYHQLVYLLLLLLISTTLPYSSEGSSKHRHRHRHGLHAHHQHRLSSSLLDDENLIEDNNDFLLPRSFRNNQEMLSSAFSSPSSIVNISLVASPFFPTLSPMLPLSSTSPSSTTTPSSDTSYLNLNEIVKEDVGGSSSIGKKTKWNFTQVNLANSHLFYIRTKFACSKPRPKLVKVLDYHASPLKQYVPRCTVLHRCDDEGGCCEEVTHRCEASKTEMVELYFHVIRSDIRNNITGGNAVGIERLTFLNHTQCECRPINYMPRTMPLSASMPIYSTGKRKIKGDKNSTASDVENKMNSYHKCRHVVKCPEPFVYRFRDIDRRCVCDCHGTPKEGHKQTVEQHRTCLGIQSGEQELDSFWARCVRIGECAEPICGSWMEYNPMEANCHPVHRLRHGHRRRKQHYH